MEKNQDTGLEKTPDTRPEILGAVRSWELWPILVPFIVIFIAYGYWRWT